MAAAMALGGPMVRWDLAHSFANMVSSTPQPILEVVIPWCGPKLVDNKLCVVFSKEEISLLAQPFKFSLVMKFLR